MGVMLHGPSYSIHARTALEEKGVPHTADAVDILSGAGPSPAHLEHQPWGKVPALEHDGFMLFQTFTISR